MSRAQQGLLSVAIAGSLGVLGCSVGEGTGHVYGPLSVPVCGFESDGTPTPLRNGASFNLQPDFFVGQPIDSSSPRFPANQVLIRVQNSGSRLEFADAVLFWILDSYEAARCMLGLTNADGTPDWDPTLCDWSTGAGRLLIGTEGENVSSDFFLNDSCPNAKLSAMALGTCGGGTCPAVELCPGRGSWLTLSTFGNPARTPGALKPSFRVNDGERITASMFHVEMCDQETIAAVQDRILPVPPPAILGVLEGDFDFHLDRGQAGQPFP